MQQLKFSAKVGGGGGMLMLFTRRSCDCLWVLLSPGGGNIRAEMSGHFPLPLSNFSRHSISNMSDTARDGQAGGWMDPPSIRHCMGGLMDRQPDVMGLWMYEWTEC